MFKALLEKMLLKYLGEYITGINRKEIELGLWRGKLNIFRLGINEAAIDKLGLPLEIKYSHIEKF